jgi:MFS family permease
MASAAAGLLEGLQYVRRHRGILAVFLLVVAHCTLTMSFDSLLPAFAKTNLDSPTNGLTILIVAVGSGAFVGTLGLALLTTHARGPLFFVTALVSGASPILLAASQGVLPAAASAVMVGASQAMFMALAAVFLQEVVDDAVRGRVMSLYLMSAGGIMAFANLALGSLTDVWGAPLMLLLPAVLFLVVTLVSFVAGSHLRRIYSSGSIAMQPAPVG